MSRHAAKSQLSTVLLIEDEPSVMACVRAALERGGYSVVCCPSGVEALDLLRSGTFLGIISDMRTPGGVNGADVHAWLTEHRPELSSRLVFITRDLDRTTVEASWAEMA